ncbi:MAG: hypothetical protein HY079_10935 [Elusimicrobia bacterium]|nr:hypothetical protein [Elusimicrobiota bacterium]
MRPSISGRRAAGVLLGVLLSAPAAAKVVFTGYADFVTTPQGSFKIDGPPAVLSQFALSPARLETRGSGISAIGLFATTSLSDAARLQMDVTYRDVGSTVKTLSIQYAYLEYDGYGGQGRVGKITLPFGWYNQHRFYGFQRPSISAPLFQGSILGLPIADMGAGVQRPFTAGPLTATVDLYAVNGYGPVPGSTETFRSATLPGGLTIAKNLGSSDANHKVAVGARVDVAHRDLPDTSAGASYYRGEWDAGGKDLLQMANAHLRASGGGFELLGEALLLVVKGDQGFAANLGTRDWRTEGFFVEADYRRWTAWGKPLTPWARFEDYFTHGSAGGGREALWEAAGGASLRLTDGVLAKFEASDLYYRLPFAGKGDLTLTGYSLQLGLTVTF